MLDIETIEQNLDKLTRIEASLKAKFGRGEISEQQYQQNLARVGQEQKKWKSQLEDSIADLIFQDADAPIPGPAGPSDPLAQTLQQRHADQQPLQPDEIDPAIKISDVKRGLQDEARALEIKFSYQDTNCKAIINNKEGRWHFSTQGQTLYLIQFINALQKSQRFAEVFEKEVSRHPDAWHHVMVEGREFVENDKRKNSRDNFPEICRRILLRHTHQPHGGETHRKSHRPGVPDLTGKPVVVHKVEHGEYTKAEKRDFGRGISEFPRYIMVLLDWGKYHLRAEITTASGQWEVVPSDLSRSYPKQLLQEFKLVVPFMVQELERAGNKYLAHTLLTEMRHRDYRHQWQTVIQGHSALYFPHQCRQLLAESLKQDA